MSKYKAYVRLPDGCTLALSNKTYKTIGPHAISAVLAGTLVLSNRRIRVNEFNSNTNIVLTADSPQEALLSLLHALTKEVLGNSHIDLTTLVDAIEHVQLLLEEEASD